MKDRIRRAFGRRSEDWPGEARWGLLASEFRNFVSCHTESFDTSMAVCSTIKVVKKSMQTLPNETNKNAHTQQHEYTNITGDTIIFTRYI